MYFTSKYSVLHFLVGGLSMVILSGCAAEQSRRETQVNPQADYYQQGTTTARRTRLAIPPEDRGGGGNGGGGGGGGY